MKRPITKPSSRETSPPRGEFRRGPTLALAVMALVTACGSTPAKPIRPEFDLHDPSATRRTQAVAEVASTRDTSHVPALIALLDDEDAAVRLSAGRALRDLTGHDTGYRASAPPAERAQQAESWRTWWAARSKGAASSPPAPTAVPAAPTAPRATGGPRVGSP